MTIGPTVQIPDYVYQTHVTEISLFLYMTEHNHIDKIMQEISHFM